MVMPDLNRREAALLIGAGAAGFAWLPRRPLFAAGAPRPAGVDELAERLRTASGPAGAFDVAAAAIKAGAGQRAMLGAIFLCGAREIRPRPYGILHAVMMVGSTFQLADAADPGDAWLPIMWNLDDLKRAQEQDRVEVGDWRLPARKAPRATAADAARREFVAAMEAWDDGRADRALVALLPHHDHDSFFEVLWPLACRCSAFIGHKMIYASQVERTLRRIGWEHAEAPLRSLVMALLYDRQTEAYERARELAPRLPADWPRGREDPARSESLLRELRGRDPRAAQEVVLQAFTDGLGPQTLWDALRLLASEVFLRRPGRSASSGRAALLPVHALTVTDALGHAFLSTKLDGTKRLIVLQAAAWLATVRDAVVETVDLSMAGPGIETLGTSAGDEPVAGSEPGDLAALVERASPGALRPFLDREPGQAPAYLAHLRRALFRRAQEVHQLKYAAAMQEESRLVHPRWASRVLAPAVDYLANPQDSETEIYRRSVQALRKAGAA